MKIHIWHTYYDTNQLYIHEKHNFLKVLHSSCIHTIIHTINNIGTANHKMSAYQ